MASPKEYSKIRKKAQLVQLCNEIRALTGGWESMEVFSEVTGEVCGLLIGNQECFELLCTGTEDGEE